MQLLVRQNAGWGKIDLVFCFKYLTAYCNVQSYRKVCSFPVEKLPVKVDIVIPGFLGASVTLRNRIDHILLSPVSVRSIILGGLPSQLHEVTAKLIVSPVTNFGEGDRWTQIIDVSGGFQDSCRFFVYSYAVWPSMFSRLLRSEKIDGQEGVPKIRRAVQDSRYLGIRRVYLLGRPSEVPTIR